MQSGPRSTACIKSTTNRSDDWDSFATHDGHHAFQATERFVMVVQYLAAHRFGLGRRFDDPAIEAPKDRLIRQLDESDPAPTGVPGLAGRVDIAPASDSRTHGSKKARDPQEGER